jgi:hypothetical protein
MLLRRQRGDAVSSGYIPAKGEPDPDEILGALRKAPRISEMTAEEVARQLVLEGRLQGEPSPALVAEMLQTLEAEESTFEAEEPFEEGKPT